MRNKPYSANFGLTDNSTLDTSVDGSDARRRAVEKRRADDEEKKRARERNESERNNASKLRKLVRGVLG